MRPYQIAQHWVADPEQILRLFLYATKVGMLNLSWNLICPNCRVSKENVSSLSQLNAKFHCDLCGIDYESNFEKYVELFFSVHPLIRTAYAQTYCMGGPMITPHVHSQKIAKQGDSIEFQLPSNPERYRFRVLQVNHLLRINLNEQTQMNLVEEVQLEYGDEGWKASSLTIDSSTKVIRITNHSTKEMIVVLEVIDWSKERVTASKVTAMQEFRDLFSSEVLAPGQQVGIESVTILFSDVKGSTMMYEEIGDSQAYGQVRKHFDILTRCISNHSGSVVKTIGDAVMAVFHLPEDAVKAAIQIQHKIAEYNQKEQEELILKIGVFSGPAIVVNSNDRLDYFGRTVNIAARIQGESIGNDLVISKQFLNSEERLQFLHPKEVKVEQFRAKLRGIEEEFDLVRIIF